MSSAQDTVQKYFEELLSDTGEGALKADRVSSPKSNSLTSAVDTSANVASSSERKDRVAKESSVDPVTDRHSAKTKTNVAAGRGAALSQKPQQKGVLKTTALDVEPKLQDEKKQQLQKLLSPRVLAPKIQPKPQPEKDPSPAVKTPPAAADALAKPPLRSAELDLEKGQKQPDPKEPENRRVNGRPAWAGEPFEVLLFEVGGLTLAVPLITLGQIVPLDRESLTPIFGQSEWFIGILPSAIGRLRVVNTAQFVMPEKYQEGQIDKAQYAISLEGVPWALAVDKVNQPVRLDPSEVKWRSSTSKRPWLAGTVKSAMCALLDITEMASIMNASDGNLDVNEH